MTSRYEVRCMPVNCLELGEEDVTEILKAVLYEFPMQELDLYLPPWVDALPAEHPIKAGLYDAVRQGTGQLRHIREVEGVIAALGASENISEAKITSIDLGTGVAAARLGLPRELFYKTLSEQSGFDVSDDGDLMSLLTKLAAVKSEYDKVAGALKDVRETGYGIVVPGIDELKLEEPEIMKQGGRYGVRLKASAPSIHMIRRTSRPPSRPSWAMRSSLKTWSTTCSRNSREIPARSGSLTSSDAVFMNWSTRTCRPSSSACRKMPGKSCRRP